MSEAQTARARMMQQAFLEKWDESPEVVIPNDTHGVYLVRSHESVMAPVGRPMTSIDAIGDIALRLFPELQAIVEKHEDAPKS